MSYLPPIPPRFGTLANLEESAFNVVNYFLQDERFEYVQLAGTPGAQGGALLYNERNLDGSFLRQLIVKYYNSEDDTKAEQEAEQEANILTQLIGAEPVVQLVDSGGTLLGDRLGLVQEYIGHGTLSDVFLRCLASNPTDAPSLEEALEICQDAVLNKTERDFTELPNKGIDETDDNVRRIVQEFMLDGDFQTTTRDHTANELAEPGLGA
ncbi:Uu.00g146900.m01.CDS01 [Anthostomella pinea]|uniref:Uu.00g146900.m01.CDS01 n=1 Tax=Anthostomella pinea TaxID=933095 RepID=A0AAI8YM14_9PEZI|nr:Uu.00g146900.m01.CDS01 [Anthostomella pinea]